MTKNVGNFERFVRGLVAAAAVAGALWLPLSPAVRFGVFGTLGAALALTALSGTCLGYRLMGKSTCPRTERA